nr:hypothetical protein [Parabacteroides goldsteinii]
MDDGEYKYIYGDSDGGSGGGILLGNITLQRLAFEFTQVIAMNAIY